MSFGQVVVGPPGSGKTVYCLGMKEFLEKTGRNVVIVNLDPANENLPYPFLKLIPFNFYLNLSHI
jgi:hypothetical protein